MPAADTVLLPLAAGLTLLGVLVAVLSFRRGRRGRLLQGLAVALLPAALYLTGLLGLVWDAVVAVVRWAGSNVFDLGAWIGFGLLAVCVVLWVVGGIVARRSPSAKELRAARAEKAAAKGQGQVVAAPSVRPGKAPATKSQPAPQDDDMAEIEALLKSRGIQ
jgi:hypothetical protein